VFWLSHHFPEEHHRCYRLGGLMVCARCVGTYPVMLLGIVGQLALPAPLSHPLDLPIGLALVVPATLDWARGRLSPAAGSNGWRTVTGVLLGLGLARSLFIHLQKPLPMLLVAQATLVTLVGVPVILTAYWRSRRR